MLGLASALVPASASGAIAAETFVAKVVGISRSAELLPASPDGFAPHVPRD
jgi:hypothetical protein